MRGGVRGETLFSEAAQTLLWRPLAEFLDLSAATAECIGGIAFAYAEAADALQQLFMLAMRPSVCGGLVLAARCLPGNQRRSRRRGAVLRGHTAAFLVHFSKSALHLFFHVAGFTIPRYPL